MVKLNLWNAIKKVIFNANLNIWTRIARNYSIFAPRLFYLAKYFIPTCSQRFIVYVHMSTSCVMIVTYYFCFCMQRLIFITLLNNCYKHAFPTSASFINNSSCAIKKALQFCIVFYWLYYAHYNEFSLKIINNFSNLTAHSNYLSCFIFNLVVNA